MSLFNTKYVYMKYYTCVDKFIMFYITDSRGGGCWTTTAECYRCAAVLHVLSWELVVGREKRVWTRATTLACRVTTVA